MAKAPHHVHVTAGPTIDRSDVVPDTDAAEGAASTADTSAMGPDPETSTATGWERGSTCRSAGRTRPTELVAHGPIYHRPWGGVTEGGHDRGRCTRTTAVRASVFPPGPGVLRGPAARLTSP